MSHRTLSRMVRVERDDFFDYIARNALYDTSARDEQTGKAVTVHYDRSGNLVAAAAYGIAPRAIYKIKVAHVLAALFVGASLLMGGTAHAASKPDPFPLADVGEVESHSWTVGVRKACEAVVRSYADGTVTVQLRGAAPTFPHAYRSEDTGIVDMLATHGRDC